MSNIVKRDPFASLFSWPSWMGELEDFGSQRGLKIHETDHDIIVEAVVAGIPANDVDVDIEDGVLTVKAETKSEQKEEDGTSTSMRRYYYTTALSGGAWDKASAEVEHGVLKVRIPKTEAARPRKITVKAKEGKK